MPLRELARPWTLVLALLGGLVTEAAFPGRSWWPAAMVGVALLALALQRDSARWGAVVGFAWGLAFFFPHLYWLYVSVGAVPWVALVVLEAAFVAGFGAAWVWCRRAAVVRRTFVRTVVFAALWITVEQARSIWPFGGFPWGRLAFSQTDAPTLALASLGGAPLVSAVVAAAGLLLAQACLRARERPRTAVVAVAGAGVLAAVGLAVPLPRDDEGRREWASGGSTVSEGTVSEGTESEGTESEGTGREALRVAAVQGNVARPGLDAFSQQLEVLRNHVDGTSAVAAASDGVDVVLWPENAADVDPRVDSRARRLLEEAVRAVDAPILVGTVRYDELGRYNDSVLWTPGEGPVAVYTKQHPAPFGEYIPMRGVARLFSDKVDLVRTDMLPGTDVGVLPLDVPRLGRTVTLADAICFEVAYDSLVRDAVRAGGEVIVVQTNNASFGWTQESVQQFAMTRLRAVEHGRASVQISTVGVSGVVAPDGTVLDRTELFTADQMVAEVPVRGDLTLSARLGLWPVLAAFTIAAAAVAAGAASSRRRASDRRGVLAGAPS